MTQPITGVDASPSSSTLVRRSVLTFVGIAGASAGLCTLFLSMRSIMDIGGVCASGNTPFQPRVPCPSGVPGLMMGSIFLGLVFLGIYASTAFGINLTLLVWPALFLSLGFNFADYGLNPPPGFNSGGAAGWIVCAVVFFLMGGIPLGIWIYAVVKGRESRTRSFDQDAFRQRLRMGSVGDPVPTAEARTRRIRTYAIVLQLSGIVVGIYAGMQLFEWVTGSKVSVGFR